MQSPMFNAREVVAGAFVAFVFCTAVVVGFKLFGWLGMGITGVAALLMSNRAELFSQHGDVIDRDIDRTVRIKARIEKNAQTETPEMRLAGRAQKARADIHFRIANTFFGAVAMLGLGMFAIRVYGFLGG